MADLRYTVDVHGMGYVYLTDVETLASETVSIEPRFHIDLDDQGRPIGVEVFATDPSSVLTDALYALTSWIHRG